MFGIDQEYDRGRLALYLCGLLPDEHKEAEAVLVLCTRLLPVLSQSRQEDRAARLADGAEG